MKIIFKNMEDCQLEGKKLNHSIQTSSNISENTIIFEELKIEKTEDLKASLISHHIVQESSYR
jgi:hypothetical protein